MSYDRNRQVSEADLPGYLYDEDYEPPLDEAEDVEEPDDEEVEARADEDIVLRSIR